jgi:(E)-4-hydroxy-3-methyl-but-2-enyl pyrophosphate reductase
MGTMYFFPMKIIVAQTAGFCMGVKRAVDLALELSGRSQGIVYTLGPLIHNNQTVEMLRDRGVTTLDESKPVPAAATILIRAHGVPLEVQTGYKNKGHVIVDGTCPKVKTVHRVIEKYRNMGFAIVITGDKGHAEVIGLQGYAGDHGHLIQSPDDVERLPPFDKICLVSQTTFDLTLFDSVAERIRKRYSTAEVVIKKTICSATDQRQSETRDLAARVDAMIVVGGKNSANTMRLAGIAAEVCRGPVQHIETESEIDWDKIATGKTVGITAGASTPNWMINRVIDHLKQLDQTKKKGLFHRVFSVFDFGANLNIFVSTGAICVYYASCILQGLKPEVVGAIILFLYFFSMYLWNSLTIMEKTRHLDLSRYKFYNARKKSLYIIAAITIFSLIVISSLQNKYLFYLISFAIAAGSAYHLTIIPKFLLGITRYKSLKDIPTSRDLFVALSWAILITFVPHVIVGDLEFSLSTWFCFSLIFVLAFLRSLIFDLRDIEGDRIMGRETLVTIIGENKVKKAIQAIIAGAIALLIVGCIVFPSSNFRDYFSIKTNLFLLQIVPLLYLFFFMLWNRKNKANRSVFFNLLADAQFYISGFCAWLGMTLIV